MADNFTSSLFMSFIDDAERIVLSDPDGDRVPYTSYILKNKHEEKIPSIANPLDRLYAQASSCHACSGFESRRVFASPVRKQGARVLFIAPYPESEMIFTPQSLEIFKAWWKPSLLLEEGEWALTTLIKCPVSAFSEEAANACRAYLREEMAILQPKSLILLGYDTARFMTRREDGMSKLRMHRFNINHIPTYVTYTPSDYLHDASLKRVIWQDMLYLRKELGTEGRGK
ncbi:MAG: hypothetical protein IAA97_05990 [Spirochaetes bacterium]|uniref:Uracil-DNA glycosylase-like domain-containing protein n=1 Tax=Candidatus Ornithospirochaeta stercoripullorum TaxID=2840899 RepID=A0A9D9DZM3_9SPIO|nr:hypothetical protein [Candidatus Ornithospirochaeta stercoripullorum]